MPAKSDYILILRADLPRLDNDGAASAAWWDKYLDKGSQSLTEQGDALYHLARSEQLREREAEAEQVRKAEAEAARGRRRDEVTRELTPEAHAANNPQSYKDQSVVSKRAIDRIIELEQA